MIAISSFRPFKENEEYALNQERAHRTWLPHFTKIAFFNQPEARLGDGEKTIFIGNDERPTIKAMAAYCMRQSGWSCIINSDIVLHPRFLSLEKVLEQKGALCAISRRFTIFSGDVQKAFTSPTLEPDDLGLDIFIARQPVWAHVYQLIPDAFKIGMIVWDQWVSNCFCRDFRPYCYDFTPSKLVFHPKHDGRPSIEFHPPKDRYLSFSSWPRMRLNF